MTALSLPPPQGRLRRRAALALAPAALAAFLAAGLARCGADAPVRALVPPRPAPLHAPAAHAAPAFERRPA